MTLKNFRRTKLVMAVIIAIVVGQSIVFKNYLLPLAVLVVGVLLLVFLRRQVKEIIADERDYLVGGRSALLAIQIYSWIAVIAMLVFYNFRDSNPVYGSAGITLAFSTCVLMLLYSIIFYWRNRSGSVK